MKPTSSMWAVKLDPVNMRAVYLPERFAHGYQALQDDTVANYDMGAVYTPSAEGGLPHDDPRLGISWPAPKSYPSGTAGAAFSLIQWMALANAAQSR